MARKKEKKIKPLTVTAAPESKNKAKKKKKAVMVNGRKSDPRAALSRKKALPPEQPACLKSAAESADVGLSAETAAPSAPVREEVKRPENKIPENKIKVLFVCTGNTCRSAMAEYLFRDYLEKAGKADAFEVSGAGLDVREGSPMSENALICLKERGIDGSAHRARQLEYRAAEESDLIVCMTAGHKRAVGTAKKLMTVGEITGGSDVPDPFCQGLDVYRKTADYLTYACADVCAAAEKLAAAGQKNDAK